MKDQWAPHLRAINSMTKYPSIPTYHELDPRNGNLLEKPVSFLDTGGPVIGTEKIDGANARIIYLPDGTYLLGSREELLYARGDLVHNPAQSIVEALREMAEPLSPGNAHPYPVVYYVEVYGGKGITQGSKHYTTTQQVGFRLFDVATFPRYETMLNWEPERIASWRDAGKQEFVPDTVLQVLALVDGFDLVPRLFTIEAADLPVALDKTYAWLTEHVSTTWAPLDGVPGRGEGIVLRSWDRSVIAKAKLKDYERTLKRRNTS